MFTPRSMQVCRILTWLIFIFACGRPLSPSSAAETPEAPFRIGFSRSMFTDVNQNDAKAAVKVWGRLLAKEHNVPTDPDPAILTGLDALLQSLQKNQVDAIGVNLIEYAQLRRKIDFDPIFVTYDAGFITEQYVLLVHREGCVKILSDLGGCSLSLLTNPRSCLAPLWLDTLLVKQGHPAAARFIGKTVQDTKLLKVLLPVFFGQIDACIVTRSGFDIMNELNPQLAKKLVVLAESSAMVPAVFVFRSNYQPSFRKALITGVNDLKNSPAGRQVLTLFKSEDIEERSADCLETGLELIAAHEQLMR